MARTTENKEGRATVKVVYYTHKTLADGSHPFIVRITKNRKNRWVSTGLSLHPKYWNKDKSEIRKSYPEPYREDLINDLKNWEKKIADAEKELARADESYDAADVATKAAEKRKATRNIKLLGYIDELVEAMVVARQKGNSVIYRDLRNQLADFLIEEHSKAKDIAFKDVTVRFCNSLETFFRKRGNSDTTLSNRFRTLRAVLNKAIAEGVTKPEYYPFARNVAEKHKFSIGKFDTSTQKRAISRDDVRKIENFTPAGTHSQDDFKGIRNAKAIANQKNAAEVNALTLAKNIFLFSFYCGGVNFVDLAQLQWQNIVDDNVGTLRLTYVRQKTGGKFVIKLLPTAAAILASYRPETYDGEESYIFPILNHKRHNSAKKIDNRLHKILAFVNRDLKVLGERAGLKTPLTTYVARHSFATNLRQAGVPTAVISQAMGHKTEAVTAVYLDSFTNETVDSALENLL